MTDMVVKRGSSVMRGESKGSDRAEEEGYHSTSAETIHAKRHSIQLGMKQTNAKWHLGDCRCPFHNIMFFDNVFAAGLQSHELCRIYTFLLGIQRSLQ